MSPLVLACASMDADAWTNTLYLAKRVLSAATSTSMIRPLAASILVLVVASTKNKKRLLFKESVCPLPIDYIPKCRNIINLATSSGTVVCGVLGPFIQLKIDRFYNFIAAHSGDCLNQMPCITLSHMSPLVFHIIIRKPFGSFPKCIDKKSFGMVRACGK